MKNAARHYNRARPKFGFNPSQLRSSRRNVRGRKSSCLKFEFDRLKMVIGWMDKNQELFWIAKMFANTTSSAVKDVIDGTFPSRS